MQTSGPKICARRLLDCMATVPRRFRELLRNPQLRPDAADIAPGSGRGARQRRLRRLPSCRSRECGCSLAAVPGSNNSRSGKRQSSHRCRKAQTSVSTMFSQLKRCGSPRNAVCEERASFPRPEDSSGRGACAGRQAGGRGALILSASGSRYIARFPFAGGDVRIGAPTAGLDVAPGRKKSMHCRARPSNTSTSQRSRSCRYRVPENCWISSSRTCVLDRKPRFQR